MTTSTTAVSADQQFIVNIAAYRFVALENLPELKAELVQLCKPLGIKGTILLSPEGINLFLAAERSAIDQFLESLRAYPQFADLEVKESVSDDQPFSRMLVRLKKEIIAFGIDGIDPVGRPAPKLPAKELKQWLDEGKEVVMLDTRNDYEVEVGTFADALPIGVDHFRDFPAAVQQLDPALKDKPIVMFCTGGIRCEKAGPYMEQQGFKHIYQLEGGILKYFEEVGGDHWDGECFVFDKRVALDPALQETATTQCYACQHPLTPTDQEHEDYIPGKQCAYCAQLSKQRNARLLKKHRQALEKFKTQLPGSQPYDNVRPLNVPQRFAGSTLLDFVDQFHPHMGREFWSKVIAEGRLQLGFRPMQEQDIVQEGMMIRHVIPNTTDPDVNCDIQILFEDDDIVVVNKPAPLPVHPSGRFHRNTLLWMLQQAYAPQKLRAVHRLDANTSGVMVVARKRNSASAIAPLFQSGDVEKTYLARVQGHPAEDQFQCLAAISSEVADGGLRTVDENGLPAETHFKVLERFSDGTALLQVQPLTGRTNQIRIHLWHLGIPIVGDTSYLADGKLGDSRSLDVTDSPMCLHAWKLAFKHPSDNEKVSFEAEAPAWASPQPAQA